MLHLPVKWILDGLWVGQNFFKLIFWCPAVWSSQVCECVRRVLRSSLYREPCGSHRTVCSNCWQRQTQRQSRQSNRFDGQRVNTTVSRLCSGQTVNYGQPWVKVWAVRGSLSNNHWFTIMGGLRSPPTNHQERWDQDNPIAFKLFKLVKMVKTKIKRNFNGFFSAQWHGRFPQINIIK